MDNFLKVPKVLLSAKHFVSPATGEHVELTPTSKLYLCMLIDRNRFFKNQGQKHYDTHQYFADELGVSESGIRKLFDTLKKHGVIKVSTTKHRCSGNKVVYDDVAIPTLVDPDKSTKLVSPANPIIVKPTDSFQDNHQPTSSCEPPAWFKDAPQFDDYDDNVCAPHAAPEFDDPYSHMPF